MNMTNFMFKTIMIARLQMVNVRSINCRLVVVTQVVKKRIVHKKCGLCWTGITWQLSETVISQKLTHILSSYLSKCHLLFSPMGHWNVRRTFCVQYTVLGRWCLTHGYQDLVSSDQGA